MKHLNRRLDKIEQLSKGGLTSLQMKILEAEQKGIPLDPRNLSDEELYEIIGIENNPTDEELERLSVKFSKLEKSR